jgi:hypothetical protein
MAPLSLLVGVVLGHLLFSEPEHSAGCPTPSLLMLHQWYLQISLKGYRRLNDLRLNIYHRLKVKTRAVQENRAMQS